MILHPVILPVPQDAPVRTSAHVRRQRDAARLALHRCAKRSRAPLEGWTKNADDVPLPNAGFHWSVSHSRHWAAAVIMDRPVGIDIEHVVPRERGLHSALAGDAEWELMGDRSWLSFFRLWTAKEATLKANGTGISRFSACQLVEVRDEDHLAFDYGGRTWHIEHFYHADHIAAVTCGREGVDWFVLE